MKRFQYTLLIAIITMCSFSPKENGVTSIMDTDKGRELGEEALSLAEGETEAVSDEDSPIVLAQCLRDNNYNVSDPKNFFDLYLSVSAIFEELSQTEQEELWNIIEDCAETYNLWGINDQQEWEDPAELEQRWDFNLHMAQCFRDQGYDNVADPNPFNPATTINYTLSGMDHVRLSVYNLTGQLIETLVNNRQDAGSYTLVWDAARQPSGMYILRLKSGGEIFNQKLMIIK